MVLGLGMRLCVHMHTRLVNGILCIGQQLGSAVNSLIDRGKFEAMKSLSEWKVVHCDEHQFHAKIKMSTWSRVRVIFDKNVTPQVERKKK